MKWYYTQNINEKQAVIDGDENKHLCLVMRAKVGDRIVCFNGNGIVSECEIAEIGKNQTKLNVLKTTTHEKQKTELVLVAAAIKGERQDTLIRQATELGVTKIILTETERSEVRLKGEKKDKIMRQFVACCKQCHRPFLPEIEFSSIEVAMQECSNFVKIFGDIGAKTGVLDIDFGKIQNNDVVVFVGPEGGFTESEEEFFKNSGAIGVSLGSNILRADTACAMLVSLIKAIKQW